MSALVEVLDVSLSDFDSDQLHGRGIDTPQAGDSSRTFALEVEGWVLGRRPIEKVRFVYRGGSQWEVPLTRNTRPEIATAFPGAPEAERTGFRAALGTLRLPPEFELLVNARFENGEAADLATVRGRRARLRLDEQPRIQPLVISGFGRSGTTAVTRMLEALPSVVAYETYSREPSVASYWMGILTALAEPDSYRRQTMHAARRGNWWLGGKFSFPPRDEEPVERLIGVEGVESLAAFCESRISALYERIAADSGKSQARYFVEKYGPGVVPEVLWDVYPGGREIILVRDFRDVAASMLAFGVKRERPYFGRHRATSDADFIRRLGGGVSWLDLYRQSRIDQSFLLRYEDLVRQPGEVIPALLRYLDLDASAESVTTVHDAFLARTETTEAHRTTADLEASIGRWRKDFDPELRKVCEEVFRPALAAFGYLPDETEPAPSSRSSS